MTFKLTQLDPLQQETDKEKKNTKIKNLLHTLKYFNNTYSSNCIRILNNPRHSIRYSFRRTFHRPRTCHRRRSNNIHYLKECLNTCRSCTIQKHTRTPRKGGLRREPGRTALFSYFLVVFFVCFRQRILGKAVPIYRTFFSFELLRSNLPSKENGCSSTTVIQ
jgi:hypothetical protein